VGEEALMAVAARSDSLFLRSLAGIDVPIPDWQRARMLDGMTRAVAEKGYANVTVADVVAIAGVSRRTFYEQFDDKEDCFLETFRTGCQLMLGEIVLALEELSPDAGWQTRLEAGITCYVAVLGSDPAFARACVLDVLGAGPRAIELRRHAQESFSALFRALSEHAVAEDAAIGPVPDLFLVALVGGISELVQRHIIAEGAESLLELVPALVQLASAVILGAPREDVR
jgi:AcrR family transcriptional regulator